MSSINSDRTEEIFRFYDNFATTLLITLSRFLSQRSRANARKYIQNVYCKCIAFTLKS